MPGIATGKFHSGQSEDYIPPREVFCIFVHIKPKRTLKMLLLLRFSGEYRRRYGCLHVDALTLANRCHPTTQDARGMLKSKILLLSAARHVSWRILTAKSPKGAMIGKRGKSMMQLQKPRPHIVSKTMSWTCVVPMYAIIIMCI